MSLFSKTVWIALAAIAADVIYKLLVRSSEGVYDEITNLIQPTQPTQPTQSTQKEQEPETIFTQPIQPTQQTQPTQPTQPAVPTQPTQSTQPLLKMVLTSFAKSVSDLCKQRNFANLTNNNGNGRLDKLN